MNRGQKQWVGKLGRDKQYIPLCVTEAFTLTRQLKFKYGMAAGCMFAHKENEGKFGLHNAAKHDHVRLGDRSS